MTGLGQRVAFLVDLVHRGNVSEAARDIGISQPTLARIVSGSVRSPRHDAVAKIAVFYMVSLDWLLGGVGVAPYSTRVHALVAPTLRWAALMRELSWPRGAHTSLALAPGASRPEDALFDAAMTLPVSTTKAYHAIRNSLGKEGYKLENTATVEAFIEAARLEVDAWVTGIRAVVKRLGAESTRQLLSKLAEDGRFGRIFDRQPWGAQMDASSSHPAGSEGAIVPGPKSKAVRVKNARARS